MNYDDFRPCLVHFNQGSGVLVPAMDADYCYVFTAKHNIIDNKNIIRSGSGDGILIEREDIFASADFDAAVIIVRGTTAHPITVGGKEVTHGIAMTLGGFPAIRAGEPRGERFLDGQVKDFKNGEFNIFCEEFPVQDDISGISGGGVFHKSQNEWVLIGIEYSMANADGEISTQMKCCGISIFEKIISDNNLSLALPPFFNDFNALCDSSFALNGTFFDTKKRDFLSQILKNYAKSQIVKGIVSPSSLWLELEDRIFVKNTPAYCVSHKKLWTSWLEFMVISLLVDGKSADDLDMSYIQELHKKRRLLYSDSKEDWGTFLKDIFLTNMDSLEEDSTIFIANNCASPPNRAVVDYKALPPDITRIHSAQFDFTKSKQKPKPSRLVHLDGLHVKSVNDKEQEYSCIDAIETIEQIRDEYAKNIGF
jgi:hypothetical protein